VDSFDAMRQMLPERLCLRPDKARIEPGIADTMTTSNVAVLRDLASMTMLGDLGLVDPPLYRRHFEAVVSAGRQSLDWLAIWPALAVERFLRLRWAAHLDEPS
jgi:hypothetical protein